MDCLGIMDISRLDCHEVGVMSSVPLIDNHKCPVFSKGHDWDGSTCLACGYTSSRIYLERIAELEQHCQLLREASRALVINVRRGTPVDKTAVERQLALADTVAALL